MGGAVLPHQPYIREHPGGDAAVLLIHGILGTPDHFRPFLPLIPPQWAVHSLLLDGHGGSAADFASSSMARWRAQVLEEARLLAHRYGRVVMVAHSMGALLAVEAALALPQETKLLFLLAAPHRIAVRPIAVRHAWKAVWGRIPEGDILARAAQEGCSIRLTRRLWQYAGWLPRYYELFQESAAVRRLLPALRTPGYVFQSGRDELVSPRSCQLLKAHPALELSELPASSHFYYAPQDRERMLACFSGACSRLLR